MLVANVAARHFGDSGREGAPVRTPWPLIREVCPEGLEQPGFPRCGQSQRTGIAVPLEPPELQTATPDFRPHKTGDVIAALAPVETGPAEDPLAPRDARMQKAAAAMPRRLFVSVRGFRFAYS